MHVKRAERKRLIQFALFILLFCIVVQAAFCGIRHLTTNAIPLTDAILEGDSIGDALYVVQGILQQDNTMVLTIHTPRALGVAIHNLAYPALLQINGQQQTITDYAYQNFTIAAGEAVISLSGDGVNHTLFFVSAADSMPRHLEFRYLVNAFMLYLHLMIGIACLIYLYAGKYKGIAAVLLLFVVSSTVKGLNLGELPALSAALGMSPGTYNIIDGITTAVNCVLPVYLLLLLFDLHPRALFLWLWGGLIIPFAMLTQDVFAQLPLWNGISSILLVFTVSLIAYGYAKEKKAALPVMILRLLSFMMASAYVTATANGAPVSNLIFYCNYAYLGTTLYFIGIFGCVILYYLRYNRELAIKEKEYERIMLLKGLGHDLKHPVLTAKLNNQFLLEGSLTAEERESVEASLQALGRLDKMIENINDYFNQRTIARQQERISLQAAFNRIAESYKQQADCTLVVRCAQPDCHILINPLYFDRMINNLLDNAFRYNDGNKAVALCYTVSGAWVLITVEDNGRGLGPRELDKIFDVFYRSDENRSIDGLGIGLSVVKQLAASAGGSVSVQSQKGIGTKFTIRLPVAEMAE